MVVTGSRSPTIRTRVQFVAGTPEAGGAPSSSTRPSTCPPRRPAPAILLAHGFGGSKADLDGEARSLARAGYVVLAYTARGFGASGGLIHLDSPTTRWPTARSWSDYLATVPQVRLDGPGDPRVGVAGSSYGGGLALMLAGSDKRVDAVGADITWNDLRQALFPNAARRRAGRVQEAVGRLPVPAGCSRSTARPDRGDRRRAAGDSPPTCARPTSAAATSGAA